MRSHPQIPLHREEHTAADNALLYRLLEGCPEAMWLRDESGMHVYVNEKARSSGVMPGDRLQILRGKGYSAEQIASAAADDKTVLHTRQPLTRTVTFIDPSGKERTMLVMKFPILASWDRPLVGAIAVDLTDVIKNLQVPGVHGQAA